MNRIISAVCSRNLAITRHSRDQPRVRRKRLSDSGARRAYGRLTARRLEAGRLYEWPIVVVLALIAGGWIAQYHRAGLVIALLPLATWIALGMRDRFRARGAAGRRRARIVAALAAARADAFSPGLVLEGDLARGETWVAIDPHQDRVLAIGEDGERAFALSNLGKVEVAGAIPFGGRAASWYYLRLYFDDPTQPFRPDREIKVVAPSQRRALAWQRSVEALTQSFGRKDGAAR